MSGGDGGRISHRIEGGHWLLVDGFRRITGCHCGFVADPDENGYGDSVIDHIEAVVRAECAPELEATRARLADADDRIESAIRWARSVSDDVNIVPLFHAMRLYHEDRAALGATDQAGGTE